VQLGSEQSIKGLLTTMVTAGALQELGNTAGFNGQTGPSAGGINSINTAQDAANFGSNLLKNVTNNLAGSAIDSAINGKPLDEKALSSALTNALITSGLALGANAIGEATSSVNGQSPQINTFTQAVAHAMLGCAGGAATGGGCGAGAVGAVIGELASGFALDNDMTDSQAAALAKTLGAAAGVLVGGGGDNAAAVNAAATMAANAAENNRQLHKTESQKAAQLAASSGGKFTNKQIEDAMRNASYGSESVTTGVVINTDNDKQERYDPGAQFNAPVNGKSAQVLPNNGKVDPALAAFIVANTGGAESPYAWMGYQVDKVTPPSHFKQQYIRSRIQLHGK
jgi:hypothetical protein